MKKLSEKFFSVFVILALLPSMLVAQSPDTDTGDRERYVTNTNGQLLSVVSPFNNEAEVVFRQGGEETRVIGFDDAVEGLTTIDLGPAGPAVTGPVTGVGHPAMNNQGVIAVTVTLTSQNVYDIELDAPGGVNDSALLVGTPDNLTVIANTLKDVTGNGDVICNIEPMPQINDSGQVFFGATVQSPNLLTNENIEAFCDEDGGRVRGNATTLGVWSKSRKAIFRYTPGVGVERLLLASMKFDEAPEIITADPRWTDATTTYRIIDTHLIAHSHNSVTESGAAFVFAWLTDSPSFSEDNSRSDDGDYRTAILYLDGGAPQLVAATKRSPEDSTYPPVDSDFGYLGKLASDPKGRVVFKTAIASRVIGNYNQTGCPVNQGEDVTTEQVCYYEGDTPQLYVFTPNSGLAAQPLVASGDTVPGTTDNTFNGFPPLMSTNASGAVAFTAGLNIPNICAQDVAYNGEKVLAPPSGVGNLNWADPCKGVYLASANGTITELARNTRSAVSGAGLGATKWTSEDGSETFYFDGLTATAVIDRTRADRVYFVAWQADADRIPYNDIIVANSNPIEYDFSDEQFQSRNEGGLDDDDGPLGIFVWDNGTIRKVIAEGDEVVLGEGDNAWEAVTSTRNQPNIMDRLASLFGIMPAYAQEQGPTAKVVRLFLPQPQLRGHAGTGEFEFVVRAWFDVDGDDTADFDSMVTLGEAVPPVPVPVSSNIVAIILGAMLMLFGLVILRGRA